MNEAVDDHMDIARMGYADMLHDDERNRAYDIAIRICVSTLVMQRNNSSKDKYFHCLDIGTGSGLLSMMVVRAFKELSYTRFHVTALEESKPMANCAKKVIATNGMSEYITVVPTRCQDLKDERKKFNLLVAELLDTELIGEGCLFAYQDAVQNLCAVDCLFVPHNARVYAEPVASSHLFKRQILDDLEFDLGEGKKFQIEVPGRVKSCSPCTADDMQTSMLRPEVDFFRISVPKQVFLIQFDQISVTTRDTDEFIVNFPINRVIEQPPMVIMWWDLVMYDEGRTTTDYVREFIDPDMPSHILSCAPTWAKSEAELKKDQAILRLYNREVWREHWLQSVHYFKDVDMTRQLVGSRPSTLKIHAFRDMLAFWFDLKAPPGSSRLYPEYSNCCCGVHRILSRNQLAFLSDEGNMVKLIKSAFFASPDILKAKIEFAEKFQVDEPKWHIKLDCCDGSNPANTTIMDLGINEAKPWTKMVSRFLKGLHTYPIDFFEVKCAQVSFDNLTRIKSKVGKCEEFDLKDLDQLLEHSARFSGGHTESYFLWEYGCKRLDEDQTIFSSLTMTSKGIPLSGVYWNYLELPIKRHWKSWRTGWALVFWAEFRLIGTRETISTGPIKKCAVNERFEWNRHCKQLVYFLNDYKLENSGDISRIGFDIGVGAAPGTFANQFRVQRASEHSLLNSQNSNNQPSGTPLSDPSLNQNSIIHDLANYDFSDEY